MARVVSGAALFVMLALLPSCASSTRGGGVQGTQPDAGTATPDLSLAACFTGTATTEVELLNQCTSAEQIDRASQVPQADWNGQGALPPAPP